MYSLATNLKGLPIISLQTGQAIGRVEQPLLEMGNLEIVAYVCAVPGHSGSLLLISRDIRQFATDCIIVNDEDDLSEPDDIIRLASQLKDRYTPIGQRVIADTGRKLGTVEDYSINLQTSRIQRLYVRQPMLRAWLGSNLIIDRTQIIDINRERIIVRDSTVTESGITPDSLPEIHP